MTFISITAETYAFKSEKAFIKWLLLIRVTTDEGWEYPKLNHSLSEQFLNKEGYTNPETFMVDFYNNH